LIIDRRWLGSAPPTAERYARALRQWQALPGAVVRPATDVAQPPDDTDSDADASAEGAQPAPSGESDAAAGDADLEGGP
jgi:hypothetical protein